MTDTEVKLCGYYDAFMEQPKLYDQLLNIKRRCSDARIDAYGSRGCNEVKVQSNRINDSTADIAIRIVEDLQKEYDRIKNKIDGNALLMDKLDTLIKELEPRERQYVKLRYFQNLPAVRVQMKLIEFENRDVSESTIKRIRNSVLEKLEGKI